MTARLAPRSAGAVTSGRLTDEERRWRTVSEADLQRQVTDLAGVLGWEWMHVVPGMRSKGRWWTATTGPLSRWPDLTLVRARDRRLIFAECKRELEPVRPEQDAVLEVLRAVTDEQIEPLRFSAPSMRQRRIEVHVWRPSDLADPIETSRIYAVLR